MLSIGDHRLSIRLTDRAGNVSETVKLTFSVKDVRPVPPPVVHRPRRTPTGKTTISGRASPGATVKIFVDGKFVATTRAGSNGHFVARDVPVSGNGSKVTAVAVRDGMESEPSTGISADG